MNDFIDDLAQSIKTSNDRLEKLKKIQQELPSLRKHKTRWTSYLCAKEVNRIADGVEFGHSCGCCEDAVLYARPYLERGDEKIYSDPPEIMIGERVTYSIDHPYDNWRGTLVNANISQQVIEGVEKYFEDMAEDYRTYYNNED